MNEEKPPSSPWVRPGLAFGVVIAAAVVILGILGFALWELHGGTDADPDAGTIAALAAAAFTSLSSLVAAYFGIKVASEQSAQSAATSRGAVQALANSTPDSSGNGNPITLDFS